jgi:hypothetical protein
LITVGPVFVTVVPARTAKLPAVPSDTGACARALPASASTASNASTGSQAMPCNVARDPLTKRPGVAAYSFPKGS